MKQSLLPILLILFPALLGAQIYVDIDAGGGNNDGSSWADAYTDLTAALAAAQAGDELWIAEGIYTPSTNLAKPDSNWFLIDKILALYGGFDGTETSLDERDWEAHPTRLSGDVAGNDVAGDFLNFRADNAIHVVYCPSEAQEVTLDGLIISNGNADLSAVDPDEFGLPPYFEHLGAGVMTFSPIVVKNCLLEQNVGARGAALYGWACQSLQVENSTIQHNFSRAGAVRFIAMTEAILQGCTFFENSGVAGTNRPSALMFGNSNCDILNCQFQQNTGSSFTTLFVFQNNDNTIPFPTSPEVLIKGSSFLGNQAAGDIPVLLFNNFRPGTSLEIDSCIFSENTAANQVGVMVIQNIPDPNGPIGHLDVKVTNTLVDNNEAGTSIGAVVIDGYDHPDSLDLEISNCTFNRNKANAGSSGALDLRNVRLPEDAINHCTFTDNSASGSFGGAITLGNATLGIEHSTFTENTSDNGGGVFIFQNNFSYLNESSIHLKGCSFIGNEADAGGGLTFNNFTPGSTLEIDSCSFTGNASNVSNGTGGGAAIQNLSSSNGPNGSMEVNITRSLFANNEALNVNSGGGGLYLRHTGDSVTYLIDSCSFQNNNVDFLGGAFWIPGGEGAVGQVTRCEFINNQAERCCGAVGIYDADITFDDCYFEGNSTQGTVAGLEGGGALAINGSNSAILNSQFTLNSSAANGGALFFLNDPALPTGNIRLENVLIENNAGENAFFASASQDLQLTNVTLTEESTGLRLENPLQIELQNCVLNADENLSLADDFATITSRGGNLSSDSTLAAYLQGFDSFDDLHGLDPVLDAGFVPMMGSPCIDAGNPDGLTQATDLAGNERIQGNGVDIGALESNLTVSTKTPISRQASIQAFPNPTNGPLTVEVPQHASMLRVFNAEGRQVLPTKRILQAQNLIEIDLTSLPAGIYLLEIDEKHRTKVLKK